MTFVRSPLANLVPVRTGILFTSMQHHAIYSHRVCAVYKMSYAGSSKTVQYPAI
jgi:hypothetical protein